MAGDCVARKFCTIKKPTCVGFFIARLDYLAAGAAAGIASGIAAAGAEAAAGASTTGAATGAGAGLSQAAKVKAKTAAIRAERIIFNPFEISYKKLAYANLVIMCQFVTVYDYLE